MSENCVISITKFLNFFAYLPNIPMNMQSNISIAGCSETVMKWANALPNKIAKAKNVFETSTSFLNLEDNRPTGTDATIPQKM